MSHHNGSRRDKVALADSWFRKAGARADHDALDRIAEVVFDGITAAARGKPHAVETMAVLRKTMAIMIATLPDTAEGREIEVGFYQTIGGALAAEVSQFRKLKIPKADDDG